MTNDQTLTGLTVAQVIDVATILAVLRATYDIDTDPSFGPMNAGDYRVIADSINGDWLNCETAETVADRVRNRLSAKEQSV